MSRKIFAFSLFFSFISFSLSFKGYAITQSRIAVRSTKLYSTNNNYSAPQSFLAPVSDLSRFNSEPVEPIQKAFIPTGPQSLAQYEKAYKSETITKPKSETAKRYFDMVEKLSPNELLQKFAETAPRNVQEATKSTIVSILGSLPNYALDAALITTSSKLANLLYQMQLTGYMFKNAEYRMSLTRTLKGYPKLPPPSTYDMGNSTLTLLAPGTQVKGKVDLFTPTGMKVEVNAEDLMKALGQEVEDLRTELALVRDARETELRSNLLTYIQALPEKELTRLTADMSEDVVESIKMLVNALMERLGVDTTGPDVIIQQSVGAMAQLCMWQMVIGYKLREMEAFEKGVSL